MTARSLRIFVVEDHADTARGLKKYLESRGHQVIVAQDVSSALRLADEQPFDVLLSDLGLPDGNGWELLQQLRSRRPVRAIAMSGYNTDADRDRSSRVGFLQHLAKPLRLDTLMAALCSAAAA
ncbi:MAG: response regulator [Verrucomicrobiota bacterium]|nr:response regulator [Verrucomicrobiota bacterium]